jgi:alcohol dehydrogenase
MKALVCHGLRANAWPKMPGQMLAADADAIVRADKTTISGTDLHVLHGDVPGATYGASSATRR